VLFEPQTQLLGREQQETLEGKRKQWDIRNNEAVIFIILQISILNQRNDIHKPNTDILLPIIAPRTQIIILGETLNLSPIFSSYLNKASSSKLLDVKLWFFIHELLLHRHFFLPTSKAPILGNPQGSNRRPLKNSITITVILLTAMPSLIRRVD
jgi:hypothetical protein